jgi:hypothetical protein
MIGASFGVPAEPSELIVGIWMRFCGMPVACGPLGSGFEGDLGDEHFLRVGVQRAHVDVEVLLAPDLALELERLDVRPKTNCFACFLS